MDAKITKERLSRMLSYDWLKIIGLAAALIVVWMLVFTMTATRITPTQQFTVLNYMGNITFNRTDFNDSYDRAMKDGVFSYEILETSMIDLPSNAEYASTVLETRMATSEGDVVFVSDIENTSIEYEKDGEKVYDTYLQGLVRGYGYLLENLDPYADDGFFGDMKTYLNGYYGGDYLNGTLDEGAVERDFRARIEKNKDKRFKKDAEIEQGIADDIARIRKYRDALIEFYGYLESGLVQPTNTTVLDYESGEAFREGVYSLNLCPDKNTMGGLSKIAAYTKMQVNPETGEEQSVITAEDMNVVFLRFEDDEKDFRYENLLYINYVIRTVKTA